MCVIKKRTPEEQRAYLEAQVAEMEGDYNLHFAREALGCEPTRSEAARYYIEHGGASDFARRWEERHSSK